MKQTKNDFQMRLFNYKEKCYRFKLRSNNKMNDGNFERDFGLVKPKNCTFDRFLAQKHFYCS